ncbi:hypothetical protein SEA_FINKLE_21 [Gordonia phage Finkle]|uniref:Holin n=1 Tax=Gordonia phage Finkle TaxID=2926099 RepID=A0A9E7NK58_9CAUD|nr:hypothetical protein QEH33_gp21 [Gordonia phage Finkle]UTN92940.1 hypothetical protein SEA_FINKLE_21 [Gordonia phage Finkle]
MWAKKFWTDAAERAVKTGVQSFVAVVTVDASTTILDWSWSQAGAAAATAAFLSIATSVMSSGVGSPDTPSLVDTRRGRHRREGE